MCRFAAYLGPRIRISSLVTDPKHSIIRQSYKAKELEEPLNGDGFGISWFAPELSPYPVSFKEITPAWNSKNLQNIASVTESPCVFAHVRAATVGGEVSRTNCHPFTWNQFTFMHNGTIFGFDKLVRRLRQGLSDESYAQIKGSTDSEHLFSLFIDAIRDIANPSLDAIVTALTATIAQVEHLREVLQIAEPATLNLVVSNGMCLVATRYASPGTQSNSLYFAKGDRFHCADGICAMADGNRAVLVASEPLEQSQKWHQVAHNQMVRVNADLQISQTAISI